MFLLADACENSRNDFFKNYTLDPYLYFPLSGSSILRTFENDSCKATGSGSAIVSAGRITEWRRYKIFWC